MTTDVPEGVGEAEPPRPRTVLDLADQYAGDVAYLVRSRRAWAAGGFAAGLLVAAAVVAVLGWGHLRL